jgi:hypothetical protein
MSDKDVNDMTDAFDRRLQVIERSTAAPAEADAAINVYERVRTAQAICQALLPDASAAVVVALASELGAEAQRSQGTVDGDRA